MTKTVLLLVDMGDGGDSIPADQEWKVIQAFDLTGTASAWHTLGLDYNPATGAVVATYDNQTFNFNTPSEPDRQLFRRLSRGSGRRRFPAADVRHAADGGWVGRAGARLGNDCPAGRGDGSGRAKNADPAAKYLTIEGSQRKVMARDGLFFARSAARLTIDANTQGKRTLARKGRARMMRNANPRTSALMK